MATIQTLAASIQDCWQEFQLMRGYGLGGSLAALWNGRRTLWRFGFRDGGARAPLYGWLLWMGTADPAWIRVRRDYSLEIRVCRLALLLFVSKWRR